MPTLFRLFATLCFMAAVVYGTMYALATFVEPTIGEMTVRIPPEKITPAQ
jgi:hypothetical protein